MEQTFFEKKIKPILLYVGTIGAVAMSIGYIILMFVLVLGFNAQTNLKQSIVFAVVNAVVGFLIMQFLKIQGIDFAKQLPYNVKVLKEWNKAKKKRRSKHSLKFFWIKTVTSDILIKALSVGVATAGIIYIVIEGSQDYNMLLLSVVNLIMFACFGLISLVKGYDFYNNNYIPYLEEQIDKRERKIKESLEMAKETSIEQVDDSSNADSRTDILDTSVCSSNNCTDNGECMVVDNIHRSNSVLGRTIYSSNGITSTICSTDQKNYEQT